VLTAPDRDELLHWLRQRPLLHHDPEIGFTMVHAGLPPQWDLAQAMACAREVETVLRSNDHRDYFEQMYGNRPALWDPALTGSKRWRFITNCLTRLRLCNADGSLALKEKARQVPKSPAAFPGSNTRDGGRATTASCSGTGRRWVTTPVTASGDWTPAASGVAR
jgi:bis(5'-nucleosyl)-tetraphosphatase (symmetrical)